MSQEEVKPLKGDYELKVYRSKLSQENFKKTGKFLNPNDFICKKSTTTEEELFTNIEEPFKKPWQKLDEYGKINRMKKYVCEYTIINKLDNDKKNELKKVLIDGIKFKIITSKTLIDYDIENAKINKILNLVIDDNGNFKLENKKNNKKNKKEIIENAIDELVYEE